MQVRIHSHMTLGVRVNSHGETCAAIVASTPNRMLKNLIHEFFSHTTFGTRPDVVFESQSLT